jgi:hypothetical protein
MVEQLRYFHRRGLGYAELMSGKRFAANKLDLASGTIVTLVGYDEESTWPLVEWTDGSGSTRVTTIDPVIFVEFFIPVINEKDLQPWS